MEQINMRAKANTQYYIDTPVGRIVVTPGGCDDDYPGVYIDLINKQGVEEGLALVEYEPSKERIQTALYANIEPREEYSSLTVYEGIYNTTAQDYNLPPIKKNRTEAE